MIKTQQDLKLLTEYEKTRKDVNKIIKNRNNRRAKYDKCSKCVWGTKIDVKKVYCLFPNCILEVEVHTE